MMKMVILILVLLAGVACEDKRKSDFADGTVGPTVDVHCDGLKPGGVGDTNIDVTCPQQ